VLLPRSSRENWPELGRQGGRKNRRWRIDECGIPDRSVKSAEEVCEVLEETINRVRQGPFDLRAANTIGFLSGIQLKALAQRVEAPETTNSESTLACFQRLGQAAPQQEVFALFPQPSTKTRWHRARPSAGSRANR